MRKILKKRRCSKCRKTQDIKNFSKNRTNFWGYSHYCKSCCRKFMRLYFRTKAGKAAIKKATIKRTENRRKAAALSR